MIDPVMIGAVPQKRTRLVQASFLIQRRENSNEATPHLIWLWNHSRYAKRSNKPPIYSVNYRLPNSHQRTIRITTVTGMYLFSPPKVYRWFIGMIKDYLDISLLEIMTKNNSILISKDHSTCSRQGIPIVTLYSYWLSVPQRVLKLSKW